MSRWQWLLMKWRYGLREGACDDMKRVMLFGGTTEGKRVIEILEMLGIESYVSVATVYGEQVLERELQYCQVLVGRMDALQIENFLTSNQISLVIDATHPYATEVTANVKCACRVCNVKYLRIIREKSERLADAFYFPDMEAAAGYLCQNEGNVLLTTGSKDLACFTAVDNFQSRIYARILPVEQSVNIALLAGYPREHLICEKGPFTEQENIAMLKRCNARYLVTKDTGAEGGFPQKVSAAQKLGVLLLIVERPQEADGITTKELNSLLQKEKRSLCGEL